jgi:hypothetical protein
VIYTILVGRQWNEHEITYLNGLEIHLQTRHARKGWIGGNKATYTLKIS